MEGGPLAFDPGQQLIQAAAPLLPPSLKEKALKSVICISLIGGRLSLSVLYLRAVGIRKGKCDRRPEKEWFPDTFYI